MVLSESFALSIAHSDGIEVPMCMRNPHKRDARISIIDSNIPGSPRHLAQVAETNRLLGGEALGAFPRSRVLVPQGC